MKTKKYKLIRHHTALGQYLQESRVARKITQRSISLSLGYSSAQFISNFERGIAAPPFEKLRVLIPMLKLDRDKVVELYMIGERKKIEIEMRG